MAAWFGMATTVFQLTACGGGGAPIEPTQGPAVAGLVTLPDGGSSQKAVRVYPPAGTSSRWCVFRDWPDERLHVYDACDTSQPRSVPFERGSAGELMLFGSVDAGDSLLLLVYDARRNVPSGRLPGVLSDGVDIWRLRGGNLPQATLQAERLPLGGIDNLIHVAPHADGTTLCAIRRCFSLDAHGSLREWDTTGLTGFEFVEVHVEAQNVTAIVRTADDGATGNVATNGFRYALARLTPQGAALEAIDADCLPFRLTVPAQGPAWRCVAGRADVVELLRFDLGRMPHGGMMDFGASNAEGRIAWSQVYYLSGLMHLAGGSLPTLGGLADWGALRQRLRDEVRLLARRARDDGRGYDALRYAMHREPLTSALHLGRIAALLDTAQRTGHDSDEARAARNQLSGQLWALQGTIEQLGSAMDQGRSFTTLRLAKGIDFWSDGAPVPYNYISGYVSGLAALRADSMAAIDRIDILLQPLLQVEQPHQAATWNYWWSQGRDGWTAADAVSSNTPSYGGSPNIAHITYRAMDADALLRLQRLRPASVPQALLPHVRSLTAGGRLLPSLNEQLVRSGGAEPLSAPVLRRFARATAPWELQSQVWALEQLAAGL